jgi:hypothetical protein
MNTFSIPFMLCRLIRDLKTIQFSDSIQWGFVKYKAMTYPSVYRKHANFLALVQFCFVVYICYVH